MRTPDCYSACYAIIENSKWEILFQKRANTGFRDGCFQMPAGHIEWEETMKECLIREMKEELNIDILEINLEIEHISHRVCKWERTYFDVYLSVKKYTWIPKIAEPDKCSELKFIDINNIRRKELFWYDVDVIKMIEKWEKFSEIKL